MKQKSNIYTLIKNMSMSEKRYFKIFSERHTIGKQNKYVLLFNELDKSTQDDETLIEAALKKQGVNVDFISADKNYLYSLVLRSLNDFHVSRTYNLEIKETLLSVEILFYKGLYKECLKLIGRAEKLAEECENFQLMIDLLTWKKKCSGYYLGLTEAQKVNSDIDKYLALLENLKKITDLYYQSNLILARHEKSPESSVRQDFNRIMKQTELENEKNALSFYARIFFHLTHANYFFVMDKKNKEYRQLQKLVDMLNVSKLYAIENPLDYVSIYNRLLSIKKFFGGSSFFEDIKILNAFTHKVSFNKEVVAERVFVHTNTHEMEYYLINNDYEGALEKIKSIEKNIRRQDVFIEPYHMIYFYYMHAVILIFAGQFNKALQYVNTILNNFDEAARPQVFLRVEILNAIIHYELKNNALAGTLITKILLQNRKRKTLSLPEEEFLKGIRKICTNKEIGKKEELEQLKVLSNFFTEEREKMSSNSRQMSDNYIQWIENRIKRRRLGE